MLCLFMLLFERKKINKRKNVYNQYQAYFSTKRSIGENRPGDEASVVLASLSLK